MSNYKATVIKTGNSYALRVPKQYVEDAKLALGQKTTIPLPIIPDHQQDKAKIEYLFKRLQEIKAFKAITDPVVWQTEIRQDRPLPGRQ